MTREISVLNFLNLPESLEYELNGYLQIIDDSEVRSQIEDLIVSRKWSVSKTESYDMVRRNYLKLIFNHVGLSTNVITANRYSKRFCDYVMRIYKEGGYRTINQFDKKVIHRINRFDDCVIECLLKFNKSEFFDESTLTSITNCCNIDAFLDLVYEFEKIYQDHSRQQVVEYVLRCKRPLTRTGRDLDSLASIVRKLMQYYDIDYMCLSDMLSSRGKTYDTKDLGLYLYKIGRLRDEYGVDWRSFGRVLRINELNDIIYIMSLGIVVDIKKYLSNPVMYMENVVWHSHGFSMKRYFMLGYKSIGKLQLLRTILLLNLDPRDFNFNPDMTEKEMLRVFESWQSSHGHYPGQSTAFFSGNRTNFNKSGCV